MPCLVSQEEKDYYEKRDNEECYGVSELDDRITETVACELSKLVKKNGLSDELSEMAKKWIRIHEEKDRKRT